MYRARHSLSFVKVTGLKHALEDTELIEASVGVKCEVSWTGPWVSLYELLLDGLPSLLSTVYIILQENY